MSENIHHISKVEIEGLWGRFDLSWDLNADVNVLSGINGSGKSTILNCVAELILYATLSENFYKLFNKIEVFFNTKASIALTDINGTLNVGTVGSNEMTVNDMFALTDGFQKLIKIDTISTFDQEILNREIELSSEKNIRTELDVEIFKLQKKYLDYQLNISKKVFNVISKNGGEYQNEVLKIRQSQERFLEMIDFLFKETGKKINRDNNEITFLSGEKELTAYQLSSGEKQILVILLTVLVQDNKPAILFMDEPEISLHFDWQKKLIQYIRELNPNVQIILATHSPALIMEGWHDKVFEVRDLITADKHNS